MNHSKWLLLPALLLALALALPAGAADTPTKADSVQAPAAPLPQIAYEKTTLPNGLELIMVEDHRLPTVAVNLWYHVGAANETPELTGFAHLFEHMMFAASKHVPRGMADRLLEAAGGTDSNGSTDFDRTNYFDTVPSNQLELALWIHADRMGYLLDVLDQKALSNQQDVVRNERRETVENRPYGIVDEALYHLLFPKNHPYHGNVIGSHADIQAAKLDDIRRFFKQYYRPNNASLVIAGDIDKARTRALVAKYFGSFQRGPALPKLQVATPPITAERRAVVTDRVELPRVLIGWLTSPAYQPGDAELSMAAQILGGGKSSRLYKALVYEQQIAQDVAAYQNSQGLSSMFVVDVTARPGHTAQEIEAAIDVELDKLRRDGPSAGEMERARNTIETAMLSQVEKIGGSGLANLLNQYNQYVGDPGYLPKDIARYRQLSATEVQRAVVAQLPQKARVVVHGVPGPQQLAAEAPTPVLKKAGKPGALTALNPEQAWRRQIPKVGPLKPFALPRGDAFTLANGLTVIHHDNPALPLVTAELVIKTGAEANPADRPGLASFTAQLLEEGSSSRNALQIADQAAQLGAFIGIGAGADASSASVTSLKSNFSQALGLLADIVLHPAFPPDEIERQRSSRLAELSQLRESAPEVASRVALAALYGPRHPYGYTGLGTENAIRATSRDDLLGFWQQHYTPANAALVVSGDIRRDELKALAEANFGAWRQPAMPVAAAASTRPDTSHARLILVDKPGAPQTALQVAAIGAARNTPDFEALQVMNAAFGGLFTSRLNLNLRERKGYSYGIGSGFQYRRQPGPFAISSSIRTDATAPAVREIFKEVRAMRARPLSAQELENARNAQVLSLPGQFDTNHSIGASLANIFIYDLGLDYYRTLPARFAAVSAKQAQAAAGKYLQPQRLIVIGVGDQAKIAQPLLKLKLGPVEYRDADGKLLEPAQPQAGS
jgi:zinc protease